MVNSGCFITFEGGDGAGKSTLIDNISDVLFARRLSFVKTREPGGTPLGEEIRHLLLNPTKHEMSSYAELCLFLASRAQHIKDVILPALQEDKIVLCDRFNDSSIVYQGCARGLGVAKTNEFCNFVCEDLKPDITIYLDIDPSIGIKRVKKEPFANSDKCLDRIEAEHISFHNKIRQGFHMIAEKEPDRFFIVDASLSKDQVFQSSLELIEKKLASLQIINR